MNREPIEDMLEELHQIDEQIFLMQHLLMHYAAYDELIEKIGHKLEELNKAKADVNRMLEAEYEQLDIVEILCQLY